MIIDVVERKDGLVMVSVTDKLVCETAFNAFLVKHRLRAWGLLVTGSLLDNSVRARSVTPSGNESGEIVISEDVGRGITNLLEQHFKKFVHTESADKSE